MLRALPSVPIASIKRFTSRGLYTCYAVTRHVTLSTHLPRSHNISLLRYLVCHRAGTGGKEAGCRERKRAARESTHDSGGGNRVGLCSHARPAETESERERERDSQSYFSRALRSVLAIFQLGLVCFSSICTVRTFRYSCLEEKKTNKQKQNRDSFRLTGHPLVPRRPRPLTTNPRPPASRACVPSHAFSWPVPSPFSPLRALRSARAYKGSSEDRTLPFLIVASLSSSVIMSALQ